MSDGESGALVGEVNLAQPARPIDELVFKGHTNQARLNSGIFLGLTTALWILLVLSLARDIYGNTAGLQFAVQEAQTGQPSWYTRFRANPWQMIKRSVTSEDAALVIDEGRIFEGVAKDKFDAAKLSSAADVAQLIAAEITSLNATQKMSAEFPCDKMQSISESWLNSQSHQADVPRCAYSAGGDVIYQMSIVSVGSRAMPWIGVYRRDGKTWTYYNVRSRAVQTLQVQGLEYVEPVMIPRQIAKDFPELAVKVEAKKGEK